jgi:nitrate/TMAO reductase-like tetraheme cytochrome c subunit
MRGRPYAPFLALALTLLVLFVPSMSTPQTPSKATPGPSPAKNSRAPSKATELVKPAMLQFPQGTATPSEFCGACHKAIYREYAQGFGADLQYGEILYESPEGKKIIGMPAKASMPTLHALAGTDAFPMHARTIEEGGRSCNVCHFPQPFEIPDINKAEIARPKGRPKEQEAGGLTCASCHLTPDGKIRGPYDVKAPHETVKDPRIQTAAMCASCHSDGKRVVGKQTQTFLEWRDDFNKPGLGRQHCQDCHMFRTQRKIAEDFDVPVRAVARHLWTGGHSPQRVRTALSMVIVQADADQPRLDFHVINVGAGHSVPTGSNRRAVYLRAEVLGPDEIVIAAANWMFAPWFQNRPDDRKYLEADKKAPNALAAAQADAQGPHETPIRAGEERILPWTPTLPLGDYTVRARLIYDLNRYNDPSFTGDQTEIYQVSLAVKIAK